MEDRVFIVKNRSASVVVYKIPEDGIRREFAPGESKKIKYSELEKLMWQKGGRSVLSNFLQIQSEEAVQELGMHTEPEYNMSEEQIVQLMTNGSLDEFLDCLDFAPTGVIDLVKLYAVKLPLSDYNKRKALKEKTGFDVDRAVENSAADADEKVEEKATRRVVKEETAPEGRRTSGSKYKVVSRQE